MLNLLAVMFFFPGYFLYKMGDIFSSDSELAIDRVNLLNLRPKIFFSSLANADLL